jgi:hypothetical protein
MVEEALRDPLSVRMLAIDGSVLISKLGIQPGPRIGWTLNALLEEVLEDPSSNTPEHMENRAIELLALDDANLMKLGDEGKKRRDDLEKLEIQEIQQKYHVD